MMGDELAALLHKRAVALATRRTVATVRDELELIVFRAGSQRYAIDAAATGEAIEVGTVTPLPGLPPFYLGLIVHQGIVYPLVDIRPLTGAPFDHDLALVHALLFSSDERTIAIAAESVESFVRIDAASVIGGVTPDGIVLIDVHLLLGDARLVIDDRE
jgi:chemotaxis signal transduction protein